MTDNSRRSWKAVFIKACGFGSGFAFMCLLILGIWVRYSNRPKPQQPWNAEAITSTYEFATTDSKQNHVVFVYTLENHTGEDYRLTTSSEFQIFHRLSHEKSIFRSVGESEPNIPLPVFVPANGRTTVVIDDHLEYLGQRQNDTDPKEKFRADVQKFVNEKHQNLGGFVLFDQAKRYQIEFPKGW